MNSFMISDNGQEMTPEQFYDLIEERIRSAVPQSRQDAIYKRATRWTYAHSWSISHKEMSKFICDHMSARQYGKTERMIYIEDVLEDCNFHTICNCLHYGKYAEAMTANL